MNTLSGFTVKLLQAQGIRPVFMTEGARTPLADALRQSALETAQFPDELRAAHAAAGYTQMRQQPAAVWTEETADFLDVLSLQTVQHRPLLYLSANPSPPTAALKFSARLTRPEELQPLWEQALFHACTGAPGPAWLCLPPEMHTHTHVCAPSHTHEYLRPTAYRQAFPDLLTRLGQAKRPLILAGNAVHLARAEHEFKDMLKTLRLPVVTTPNALDLISSRNPYFAGRAGEPKGDAALAQADFILCLGACTRSVRAARAANPQAYWAVTDIRPQAAAPDGVFLHADLRDFLILLYTHGPAPVPCAGWLYMRSLWQSPQTAAAASLSHESFVHALTRRLAAGAVVCAEETAWGGPLRRRAVTQEGQRFILHRGEGACAAAVGASLANYRRKTLCLENAPYFTFQDLQTLKRLHLPVKLFVPRQGLAGGLETNSLLKTFVISSPDRLEDVLDAVLQTPGPVLCILDFDEEGTSAGEKLI